nr:MAG TPA: hypothetical protein [Caudoviricetes sp.]
MPSCFLSLHLSEMDTVQQKTRRDQRCSTAQYQQKHRPS